MKPEINNSCGLVGLAWYGNTTPVKPSDDTMLMNINDLQIEGIDYLQLFGKLSLKGRRRRFKINDLEQKTRIYNKTYLVTDETLNIKVGILMCEPASHIIKKDSANIKFDNQLLYLDVFKLKYIKQVLKSIGFTFLYITRLDIYRDFQKFHKFMPYELIERFMKEEYLSLSRAKFNVIGSNTLLKNNFEYLRVGKKDSGRQVYLYNKTLELKQVGNKEHIVQTWYKAGFNPLFDVWRLELSMTSKRNVLLDTNTGELNSVELAVVFDKNKVKSFYDAGLYTTFRFCKNIGMRKTRSPTVKLFKNNNVSLRLKWDLAQVDKLRMKKIILKSLIIDIIEIKERREHKTESIEGKILFIDRYVKENNLKNHLERILSVLAEKYKTKYYNNVGDFVYYLITNK